MINHSLYRFVLPIAFFSFVSINATQAGLDKYTKLDSAFNWIIERKIDSVNNNLSCRASIPSYGTWFGARVRLDKNDELVIPLEADQKALISNPQLQVIKDLLEKCRTEFLYLPRK